MANVQRYVPGQQVDMRVKLTIPHDGSANVSVVATATNRIVGDMLQVWPSGYANEQMYYAQVLPKNNTEFSVTMPDVSSTCGTAGSCVGLLLEDSIYEIALPQPHLRSCGGGGECVLMVGNRRALLLPN